MKENLVSIIMPSYNASSFIGQSIQSVLNQTYSNWELLITDDCSNDNSVEIIQSFVDEDTRIKLFKLNENRGAAIARNNSLKNAKGYFIAFLDSDDMWFQDKLKQQLDFMLRHNYPISFTSYEVLDENAVKQYEINSVSNIDYHGYLKNTIIGMSTSMINSKMVGDFSFHNIRTRQDTYLWITLLKRGFKAYGIDEILASYIVHNNSISSNKWKAAKRVWYLYYNLEKLGIYKSSYYFSYYILNAIKKRLS